MKTLLVSLFFTLVSFVANSQVVKVTINRWTTYDFPGNISLHDAMVKDSVNSKATYIGEMVYVFDLDKKIISMSGDKGWKSVFFIRDNIPTTQSILNIDAEQNGISYNFLLTENVDNEMSLVAQRFDLVNGRREGFFSNSVSYSVK